MRRRSAPSEARPGRAATCLAALAAAGLAALGPAGCTSAARADCPGTDLGHLKLTGSRTAAGCAAGAPASGFDGLYPPTVEIGMVFAYAAQGSGAAACVDRAGALAFLGTHTAGSGGDALELAVETAGAVLAQCAAGCAVAVRQTISGTLARDPVTGQPTGFTGTLTEEATTEPLAGCAPCTLPCGATWTLTGAP